MPNRMTLAVALTATSATLAACTPANLPVTSASGPGGTRPTGPVRAVVNLVQGRFSPSVVTIRAGQAVQWHWVKPYLPANITFADFHSATMDQGNYFHTFTAAGTFHYVSTLGTDMTGTVTVTG